MKSKVIWLGVLAVLLTGCGQKNKATTPDSSQQKELQAKAEQLQKDNRSILEKAEENQVITRTFVFPKDENGNQQSQTLVYSGNTFKKMITTNTTTTDEELKKGIQQVGVEEAQKQLRESLDKDETLKEAKAVPGFSVDLRLENENEYKVILTYDFDNMDVKKAEGLTYFKNNRLADLLKLTPSQYADNLLRAGATEEK